MVVSCPWIQAQHGHPDAGERVGSTSSAAIKEEELSRDLPQKLGSGEQALRNYLSAMTASLRRGIQLRKSEKSRVLIALPPFYYHTRVALPSFQPASSRKFCTRHGQALIPLRWPRSDAYPSPALATVRTATVSVHAPRIHVLRKTLRQCGGRHRECPHAAVSRRPRTPPRHPRHHPLAPLLAPHSPRKPAAPNLAHGADAAGMLPWGTLSLPDALTAGNPLLARTVPQQCARAQYPRRPHTFAELICGAPRILANTVITSPSPAQVVKAQELAEHLRVSALRVSPLSIHLPAHARALGPYGLGYGCGCGLAPPDRPTRLELARSAQMSAMGAASSSALSVTPLSLPCTTHYALRTTR
ncbi:hypothetical protein DFH06DRAFT_1318159 [Mycena polygramma]|nr:hypothetical protein DFH06DRAFT_1318159 [Mycena polygramma]